MDGLSIVAGKSGTSEQKRATKKSKGHFFSHFATVFYSQ